MRNKYIRIILEVFFVYSTVAYQTAWALRTTHIEDLCFQQHFTIIDLQKTPTGILKSLHKENGFDCTVTLMPSRGDSVVLSIYRYDLSHEDVLTIDDSDWHTIALVGRRTFRDERKTFISNGRIGIHYSRGNVTGEGFQFTYTKVKNSPCSDGGDFSCTNGKCIPKYLVCDGHNHCGDNSDQLKCLPVKLPNTRTNNNEGRTDTTWKVIFCVEIGVVFIAIMLITVILVRHCRRHETPKNLQPCICQPAGSVTLQTISSNVQQATVVHTRHDIQGQSTFTRVRQSLRGHTKHKREVQVPKQPETLQVPSMYPSLEQLPSAQMHGVTNPDFKTDE